MVLIIKVTGSPRKVAGGRGTEDLLPSCLVGRDVGSEAGVDPGITGGHRTGPGTAVMAWSEEAAQSPMDLDGLWIHQQRMALVMGGVEGGVFDLDG